MTSYWPMRTQYFIIKPYISLAYLEKIILDGLH